MWDEVESIRTRTGTRTRYCCGLGPVQSVRKTGNSATTPFAGSLAIPSRNDLSRQRPGPARLCRYERTYDETLSGGAGRRGSELGGLEGGCKVQVDSIIYHVVVIIRNALEPPTYRVGTVRLTNVKGSGVRACVA